MRTHAKKIANSEPYGFNSSAQTWVSYSNLWYHGIVTMLMTVGTT